MTTYEVAKLLGVRRQMVDKYRQRGWLKAEKIEVSGASIPMQWNYNEEAITQFYEKCEKKVGTTGRIYWIPKGEKIIRVHPRRNHTETPPEWAVEIITLLKQIAQGFGIDAA